MNIEDNEENEGKQEEREKLINKKTCNGPLDCPRQQHVIIK